MQGKKRRGNEGRGKKVRRKLTEKAIKRERRRNM